MEKTNEIYGNGNEYTSIWRQYDPRLGRWLSPDPKMKDFSDISPYNNNFNNPIEYEDPNGDCPLCLGLIGAAVEYASQVSVNVIMAVRDHKEIKIYDVAIKKVDFFDVVVSGVQATLTGPTSIVKNTSAKFAIFVAAEVIKSTVNINGDGSKKVEVSAKTLKEAATNIIVGKAADKVVGTFARKAGLFKTETKLISKAENSIAKSAGAIPARKFATLDAAKAGLDYSETKLTTQAGYATNTTVNVFREEHNGTQISITKKYSDGTSKTFYNQKGANGKYSGNFTDQKPVGK